jgi:glycosyltransferase involved in cell wall biosynthesis
LRIAVVNDWGRGGGAALAAERLACGLDTAGHDVRRFYCGFEQPDRRRPGDRLVSAPGLFGFARRVRRRVGVSTGVGRAEAGLLQRRLVQAVAAWSPDVVCIHNLHGAGLPVETVRLLSELAPVAWTLHDMWALTGGCTHAGTCTSYQRGCVERGREGCQAVGAAVEKRTRDATLSGIQDIVYVAPAEWLAAAARMSLPPKSRVKVVPNGVDLSVFEPHPRSDCRARFGVADDGVCALFCAGWLGDSNKRLDALAGQFAARRSDGAQLTLLTVGRDMPQSVRDTLGPSVVHLGELDESEMAFAYSAADVLVTVSVCETAPNTLIEAMACGRPAVGFDNAGVRGLLRQDLTGIVVPTDDWSALFAAINKVGVGSGAGEWSARCRSEACEHYGIERMIGEYVELFRALLAPVRVPVERELP